jgi:hypothetical protein
MKNRELGRKIASYATVLAIGLGGCKSVEASKPINANVVPAPISSPEARLTNTVTTLPSLTPEPTKTEMPTATVEPVISAEALSLVVLKNETGGDVVIVPESSEDYVLKVNNIPEGAALTNLKEDAITSMYTLESSDNTRKVFYSVPRGTEKVNIILDNGELEDVSYLLPDQEPENKFIKQQETFQINGFNAKMGKVFADQNPMGYKSEKDKEIVWFPAPEDGYAYAAILITFEDKSKASLDYLDSIKNNVVLVVDGVDMSDGLRRSIGANCDWSGKSPGLVEVFFSHQKSKHFKVVFLDSGKIFQY